MKNNVYFQKFNKYFEKLIGGNGHERDRDREWKKKEIEI